MKPDCAIDGCSKPSKTRGWCLMHYELWRRHGDPLKRVRVIPGFYKTCSVEGCDAPHRCKGLCGKHYQRWRFKHDQAHRERTIRKNRAARESIIRFSRAIKETAGCLDCGAVLDSRRMHFDHRPGTTKRFNPAEAATFKLFVEEMAKCDVRCASCHSKRHHALKGRAIAS